MFVSFSQDLASLLFPNGLPIIFRPGGGFLVPPLPQAIIIMDTHSEGAQFALDDALSCDDVGGGAHGETLADQGSTVNSVMSSYDPDLEMEAVDLKDEAQQLQFEGRYEETCAIDATRVDPFSMGGHIVDENRCALDSINGQWEVLKVCLLPGYNRQECVFVHVYVRACLLFCPHVGV